MTTVTCVVPAYNSERFIEPALDSILGQTSPPQEVIVADDGSTDGTLDVVAGYGSAVRVISQQSLGPAMTRNLGLGAATGEFVAFLDADDLWHPEKLARQLARFAVRPELELSLTHVQLFWEADFEHEEARLRDHPRVAGGVPGYATTALLARRSVFDTVGMFNADLWFSDAVDWFIRAQEEGCVLEVLADVLVYHRMHSSNLTRRRQEDSRREYLGIVKASLDRRRALSEADPCTAVVP